MMVNGLMAFESHYPVWQYLAMSTFFLVLFYWCRWWTLDVFGQKKKKTISKDILTSCFVLFFFFNSDAWISYGLADLDGLSLLELATS